MLEVLRKAFTPSPSETGGTTRNSPRSMWRRSRIGAEGILIDATICVPAAHHLGTGMLKAYGEAVERFIVVPNLVGGMA